MCIRDSFTVNWKDFRTERDVRAFIDKFVIPGDRDKGDKATPIAKKLIKPRIDAIVASWSDASKVDKENKAAEIRTQDSNFEAGFDTRLAAKIKEEEDNPGSVDWDKFYLQEVDAANKQVGGSDRSKNYIFTRSGIGTGARGETELWVQIKAFQVDGDLSLIHISEPTRPY